MRLTPEQEQAVHTEGNQKIEAVAGSGKTSTLLAYAKARPKQSILYLAFNRAVRDDADKKMLQQGLKHVTVQTAHALAYRAVASQGKFGKLDVTPSVKVSELVEMLGLTRQIKDYATACKLAHHVNQCLSFFCNSALLRFQDTDYLSVMTHPEAIEFVSKYHEAILHHTKRWMEKMYSGQVPMTHDFYLKLFHYLNPKLPYDVILFDEGQDASPVMLDIFLKQDAVKVIVGDRHQQIYGWRYAVNALEQIQFPTNTLTQSFRFDDGIAACAMKVLQLKQLLGDNQPILIQGTEQKPSAKTKACIARTNIKLLEKAINRLDDKKTIYYFEGGLNGYTFASQNASIYDVLNLYLDKKRLIRSELIRSFPAFENLEQYAKETLDTELDMVCQLVRKYKAELIDLLNELKNRQIESKDKATDIFSTVHKAKGMEYDIVTLTDDFITESKIKAAVEKAQEQEQEQRYERLRLIQAEKPLGLDVKAIPMPANWRETLKEEINILYVAVTRAKNSLLVSEELFQYFTGKKPESQPQETKKPTEKPKSKRKQSIEERWNQQAETFDHINDEPPRTAHFPDIFNQ